MDYVFDHWEEIKKKLADTHLLFFFDYDGTLAPIARTPQQAVISEEARELLRQISLKPKSIVAIISGRALKDVKNVIGLDGLIYVGNHGLEIEGPKIKFTNQVSARSRSVLGEVHEEMVKRFSKIKGVLIEDKGLAFSVHYRLVDKKDIQEFLAIFSDSTGPWVARKEVAIKEGKKVYEIRPPVVWDKGKTALWLLARQQFHAGKDAVLPVYFGDDSTDEDAFKALKHRGLTIFVGEPGHSQARYFVKDTGDVLRFMKQVLPLR